MRNVKLSVLLIFSSLCSCHHPEPLTQNERQGINQILYLYGGNCKYYALKKYTIGSSSTTFLLELSNSSEIEKQSDMPDVTSSNVAYTIFKFLKNEKTAYNNIQVKLIYSGGKELSFTYSNSILSLFERKMKIADNVVNQIKGRNFDSLKTLLNDTSYIKYDKNLLIANLRKIDSSNGRITQFLPLGFRFDKSTPMEKPLLHVIGILQSPKSNDIFSIYTDPNSTTEDALLINYKLNL